MREIEENKPIRLHLGCGKRDFGDQWTHIDGGNFPHLYSHDIEHLPFFDETVFTIYASHVVEYFDREEVEELLKEWHRVLVPNGILRIAVPDFHTMAELYLCGFVKLQNILGPLYGKMPMGDETIYHKTVYDFNSIKELLEKCGFRDIRTYDWRKTEHSQFDDHSQAYIPHMDKDNGRLISLNVECKKTNVK